MKPALFVGLTAAVLTACGDDPTGPIGAGTFDMQVTGAVTATVDGFAWFGTQNQGGESAFAILMTDEDNDHVVIPARLGSDRPTVGTYPISAEAWELIYMLAENNELLATFFALDGEVTITESSARRLRGTIEFTAVGTMDGEEAEVTGSVTFDARPAS